MEFALLPSDMESLRAYADALNDFISFTREATESAKPIWGYLLDMTARGEELLQAIRDRRRAALVAGVHVGEQRPQMSGFLKNCEDLCTEYRDWERNHENGGDTPHQRLKDRLAGQLQSLDDLIALAREVVKPPKRKVKRDQRTEARDKWIYKQCCDGVPYDSIARNITVKNKDWYKITSKHGIQAAAKRYAERHSLPLPPPRQQQL